MPNLYRECLKEANSQKNWFMFRRDFVKCGLMSRNHALFYQDLLNLASMDKTKVDDGDYFLCSARFLYKSLRWRHEQQTRMLNWFVKNKFIRTKQAGYHNRRWIWIDIVRVEKALLRKKKSVTEMQSLQNRNAQCIHFRNAQSLQNRNEEIPRKNQRKEPPGLNGHSFDRMEVRHTAVASPPDWCIKEATRLRRILRSKSPPVPVGNGSMAKWAEELFRLSKVVGQDRIAKVLDLYEKNINKVDGLPDIINAKQFRERFSWIERVLTQAKKKQAIEDNVW